MKKQRCLFCNPLTYDEMRFGRNNKVNEMTILQCEICRKEQNKKTTDLINLIRREPRHKSRRRYRGRAA